MLFAVAALTCAGSAVFDKTALSGGLFQLNVVHTVTMESLDDNVYTVWTSAMCFAAGKTEDGATYPSRTPRSQNRTASMRSLATSCWNI